MSRSTVQSVQLEKIQTLSLCSLYPSREFPTVVIACVYIPPSAKTRAAVKLVATGVSSMLAKYPDAPVLVSRCKRDCVLPSSYDYVESEEENTFDLIHHSATLTTVLFSCCQTTNWY